MNKSKLLFVVKIEIAIIIGALWKKLVLKRKLIWQMLLIESVFLDKFIAEFLLVCFWSSGVVLFTTLLYSI
jgi:hypothetical protein